MSTGAQVAAGALSEVESFVARFVHFPSDHARVATTLWVAHTYVLDAFDTSPRLAFLSPEPGSGKTRALEVIGSLVRRPMHAINSTPAALFRAVSDRDNRPTILFDEIDTIFGPKAKDNEELRGFLNAGHRRSGVTYRCVSVGSSQRVVAFPSFAAVALAGLHDLPDTVASRSIVVRMRRRAAAEHVEPYRLRLHEPQGLAIGERLAEAVQELPLREDPVLPVGVTDRAADVWEALLSIAQAAGGQWPALAEDACIQFVHGRQGAPEPSLNLLLLADLHAAFSAAGHPESLPTAQLLEALHAVEESPWRDLRGKPLDPNSMARRLRAYGVRSANVRSGSTVIKCYRRADLEDAWARYLPSEAPEPDSVLPPPAPREMPLHPLHPLHQPPQHTEVVLGDDVVCSEDL